ncbi:family 21 glycosyltransferase [Melampsora larici-populina 98AG31]|uniref:Ceramide glucosyltransferase n=1 Tax=Melampsora larici-populina (strain 98AG31 / pathotype 3-4-7) TaxID=747676 RepID=F4RCF5_MELLP|nr:family 21 glycosyltransferase [Melampsora larici-populina 98AG31]EGG09971.1 family 21 glycosyltransferase [Melampsora larici-populina 98AG31]
MFINLVFLLDCLAWIELIWYSIMLIMTFTGAWVTFQRFRLKTSIPAIYSNPNLLPSVSILRPLCGIDPNLEENLESGFLQEWPLDRLEILLCVANSKDPAIPIAEKVIRKYPLVNARLLIGEEKVGVNPKINNLMRAYRTARSDLLWILDSNILIQPTTLSKAVIKLLPTIPTQTRRIGLVHHVPLAILPSTKHNEIHLGSLLEYCFLNGNHARQYIAINSVAVESCIVGKSNLFLRSDLERSTRLRNFAERIKEDELIALETFSQFLGEDNMIGKTLWEELDLRHSIGDDVAGNMVGELSLSAYIRRRVRWIRVRKYMCLAATLVEPFTESILLGLITILSLNRIIQNPIINSTQFIILHLTFYFLSDYLVCISLHTNKSIHSKQISLSLFFMGWCLRESLAFWIWFYAFFGGNSVAWRNESSKWVVLKNGEARQIN